MKRIAVSLIASAVMLAACASAEPQTSARLLQKTPVAPPSFGTGEEEAILKTVDTFLLAVGNADAELEKTVAYPDAGNAYARITQADGVAPVKRRSMADLQKPDDHPDPFIERYWNPTVQVRGPIAQVWAAYELRDDGKVVHCGIDAFDLVKDGGVWKIHSVMFTMEPDACGEIQPPSVAAMRPRDGWKETPNQ